MLNATAQGTLQQFISSLRNMRPFARLIAAPKYTWFLEFRLGSLPQAVSDRLLEVSSAGPMSGVGRQGPWHRRRKFLRADGANWAVGSRHRWAADRELLDRAPCADARFRSCHSEHQFWLRRQIDQ
jgi:hypothetical protein